LDKSQPSCAENGLLAFTRAAADTTALGMEFDVELCKNDADEPELCIFHDDTMQEIDGSDDKVSELKLSEISRRVSQTQNRRFWDGVQAMPSVPSFKEMMETLVDYNGTLSVELKRNVDDLEIYVTTLIANLQYIPKQAHLIFHSFSGEMLQAIINPIQKKFHHAQFALNFSEWPIALPKEIHYLYPDYELLKANAEQYSREAILGTAMKSNTPIIPWNVNTIEDYEDLKLINQVDSDLIKLLKYLYD
jgi:glycerophosphoryl diester phosphodiesterase